MKHIYVSENGKEYATEEDAKKADEQYLAEQKKSEVAKAERKDAAVRVTQAFKDAAEAKRKANQEMQKFLDKYGTFHETFRGDDAKAFFEDPFDVFFDRFLY